MGNHVTTLFLVPLALFLGSIFRDTDRSDPSQGSFERMKLNSAALGRQLTWFGIGLSIYILLPLRALSQPPVNWGDPVTFGRFWWLVSGQLYQWYYLPGSLAGLGDQIRAWAALLLGQFGLPGLTLGTLGLVVFGRLTRLYILTLWTALVFSLFALLYRSPDSYVYLMPLVIAFAIWVGLGVHGLVGGLARKNPLWGLVLGVVLAGYFVGHAAAHFGQVDASRDSRAEGFGQQVLATAPENALVFAEGDRAVFALWYFHFALGERPDLAVIASDLLHFDWYHETLQSTYPLLALPEPFAWPATIVADNPTRPVCFVEYAHAAVIDCAEGSP
jgi:hypothetical protein